MDSLDVEKRKCHLQLFDVRFDLNKSMFFLFTVCVGQEDKYSIDKKMQNKSFSTRFKIFKCTKLILIKVKLHCSHA